MDILLFAKSFSHISLQLVFSVFVRLTFRFQCNKCYENISEDTLRPCPKCGWVMEKEFTKSTLSGYKWE